jgi:hypothetical protein
MKPIMQRIPNGPYLRSTNDRFWSLIEDDSLTLLAKLHHYSFVTPPLILLLVLAYNETGPSQPSEDS